MAQVKKSLYNLYPLLSDTIHNMMRKVLPRAERKLSAFDAMKLVFTHKPEMINSLDFLIAAEEMFWQGQGRHVIFPESEAVLDNFLKAKFSMESSQGFDLPFDSFILAMPHGYQWEGTVLPGLMVNFYDYHGAADNIIYPFVEQLRIDKPSEIQREALPIGSRAMVLAYRDPHNTQGYARALIPESKIPAILQAPDKETFAHIMGMYQHQFGVVELADYDLDIQFKAIRLIAALGVYNLATEGKRLREGFPGKSMPRMNFKNPDARIAMSTLSNPLHDVAEHASPGLHYRSWHIRQLRHQRYYRGDHASKPSGSRFVFVSEAMIGGKVDPSTIE